MKNLEKIVEKFMKDKRFKMAIKANKKHLNKKECEAFERLLQNKHRSPDKRSYNHCIRDVLNNNGYFSSKENACAISNLIWWNIDKKDCSTEDMKVFERLKIELDATLDIYSLFYHILTADYGIETMKEVNKILKMISKKMKGTENGSNN